MKELLEKAKELAKLYHSNQMYGENPYFYHLKQTASLVPTEYGRSARIVAYMHDILEDTHITEEELNLTFGEFVTECIKIVTDEDGKNRKECKSKTYAKMKEVRGLYTIALVVKLCDRLSNVRECIRTMNIKKLKMYQKEHQLFKDAVYRKSICEDLWLELDSLLGKN